VIRFHGAHVEFEDPAKSLAVRGDMLDVAQLRSYAFGPHALQSWGTLGFIAIEGFVFALAIAAYFYLRTLADTWPMGVPPPDLMFGTLNTLVLLASVVPNDLARRAANRHDLAQVRLWMLVAIAVGVLFCVLRIFEFRSLNVGWDANAYGSIVWLLLGLHTVHLLTDVLDSTVLAAVMFHEPVEGKRFVDVAENSMYWDFVVVAWLPLYAVIYWGARF
jgi:heme/copper-type cytochrome/quinol oxidase subunit 3